MRVKVKSKIKKVKKEIPPNSPCLCGSEKAYSECCRKKKFKYEVHNGKYFKKVNMPDEVCESIEEARKQFEEYYNRTPDKNDFLMSFAPSYNDELLLQIIYAMREGGIPEENIYAYYKTGGLMPTDFNTDYISDIELKEYEDFYNEYINLMNESKKGEMNALQFVVMSNSFIGDEIDYIFKALTDYLL